MSNQYDDNKIEQLLRYYLFIIGERNIVDPYTLEFRLDMLTPIKKGHPLNEINDKKVETILFNTFPEKEKIIIEDIKKQYVNLNETINKFRNDVESIKQLIMNFKQSLEFVLADEVVGIKGRCIVEDQLSLKNSICSIFRKC